MDLRQELIAQKQEWIELRRREGVEGDFRATALNLPMPPAFQDAILVPPAERAIIAHICRASLEKRGGNADSIGEMVRELTEAGASAFLISTFSNLDGMGYDDVLVAAQNTHLPVICNDVFLDPLQVTIARAHGAAAILLCAQLHDERSLRMMKRAAHELSLDTILDVASLRHVESASRIRAGYSGAEFRIFGSDLLCFSSTGTARVRERLIIAKPEHALAVTMLEDETSAEIEQLVNDGYTAFVLDVSLPMIDEARARLSEAAGRVHAAL